MKLSAEILKDELSKYVILWTFDEVFQELCLDRPEYYIDQPHLAAGHTYIAYADQLPEMISHTPGSCMICIGKPSDYYLEQNISLMVVSKNLRPQILFNLLHSIFNRYDAWDHSLQECLSDGSSLQMILDKCEPVIENPIYVIDANYDLLAFSRKTDSLVRNNSSTTILHNLKSEPLYKTLFESEKPVIYSSSVLTQRSYSFIIRDEGTFILGVAVNEAIRPFRNTDGALILHLAKYLRTFYRRQMNHNNELQSQFNRMARQLLDQEYVNPRTMEELLTQYHWNQGRQYLVCAAKLSAAEQDYRMEKLILRQLRNNAPEAQIFEYQNYIVMVFSITGKKASNEEPLRFRQKMSDLGLDYGVSESFTDFSELRTHFLEAVIAMELGGRKLPGRQRFAFADYRLDYMVQRCSGDLEPRNVCSNNMLAMIEYDRRHNTEYTKTLQTYIATRFNASQSARRLGVNRSSFLQRLDKIQSYFGIPLQEFDDILYAMLQLSLLNSAIK